MTGDRGTGADTVHDVWRRIRYHAAAGLLIAPILIRFLARDYNEFAIFNADLLMVPALFDDIARGGSMRTWHLPSAPYFVPDFPLYALARPLPNYFLDAAGFMVLQLALTWVAWRSLVRRTVPTTASLPTALLGFAGLMVLVGAQVRPLGAGLASYLHYGTFVLVIAAVTLTLRLLDKEPPDPRWAHPGLWYTALVLAAMVSDRWFALWFLGPTTLWLARVAIREPARRRSAVRWLTLSVTMSLASLVIHEWLLVHDNPHAATLRFRGWSHLDDTWSTFWTQANESTVAFVFVVVAWAMSSVLLLRDGPWARHLDTDARHLLGALTASTPLFVFGGQLVMSTPPDIRYYLPAYAWPVLCIALMAPSAGPRLRASGAAIAGLAVAWPALQVVGDVATTRVTEVACIDQALTASGSRRGIATYWDAKPITVESSLELTIAAVSPALDPDPVNGSAAHYGEPYDFAIESVWADPYTLEAVGVIPRAGEPLAVTPCGTLTVLDYGPGGLTWTEPPDG